MPRTIAPVQMTSQSVQAQSEVEKPTAFIQIKPARRGPRLFTTKIQPGGSVVFATHPEVGEVTLVFTDGQPLEGVGSSFPVLPGADVELSIRDGIEGRFPFHFIIRGNQGSELVLDIATDGLNDRTGFAVGEDGLERQQYYLRTVQDKFWLALFNTLSEEQTLELIAPDGSSKTKRLCANDEQSIPKPIVGFGVNLAVKLIVPPPNDPGEIQAGGTEQVEVIIEPD